jgi:hypothetical protein
MGDLQKDVPNRPSTPMNVQEEEHPYEDEINLIDYFRVLWKRRHLILLVSVLPPLFVGFILFFWPTDYKVTYTYDVNNQGGHDMSSWNPDEKNYNMLLDQFYGEENIDRIVNKLRENGLDKYAQLINRAKGKKGLEKFIAFEVLPPYADLSKLQITNAAQLEEIRQLKALLLNMTIRVRPVNSISKISSVIRENFENVVPTYLIEKKLNAVMREHKADMASIEENRFNLELTLKTDKSTLEKLKSVKVEASDKSEGSVMLQFDLGGKSEYLPLEYQIQTKEFKIVELEENIKLNEARYNYYKNLLGLDGKLSAELKNNASSFYTIQQFHAFLAGLVDKYESKELKDYLSSLIKKIDNRISASAPITERPKIYAVSKGTVKKSAIVFVASLMISIFAAFLCEGIQKSRIPAS